MTEHYKYKLAMEYLKVLGCAPSLKEASRLAERFSAKQLREMLREAIAHHARVASPCEPRNKWRQYSKAWLAMMSH